MPHCLPAHVDKLKVCSLLTRSPVCPVATLKPQGQGRLLLPLPLRPGYPRIPQVPTIQGHQVSLADDTTCSPSCHDPGGRQNCPCDWVGSRYTVPRSNGQVNSVWSARVGSLRSGEVRRISVGRLPTPLLCTWVACRPPQMRSALHAAGGPGPGKVGLSFRPRALCGGAGEEQDRAAPKTETGRKASTQETTHTVVHMLSWCVIHHFGVRGSC